MKTIAKASAVLLVLTGCARAQQHASASIVKELTSAWVRYYAETYHVPTELVEAIIDQESAWDAYAISSKGAAGLMQLMPSTAVRFGIRNRFRVDQNINVALGVSSARHRERGPWIRGGAHHRLRPGHRVS